MLPSVTPTHASLCHSHSSYVAFFPFSVSALGPLHVLLPLPSMHLPELFMWLLPRHSGLSSNTCFSKKASLTRSSQLSHVALCCVLFSIYPTVLTILLLNLFTRIYSRHLLKAYYVPGTDRSIQLHRKFECLKRDFFIKHCPLLKRPLEHSILLKKKKHKCARIIYGFF